MSSKAFYDAYLSSNVDIEDLAASKKLKCSTAVKYVYNNYNSHDAEQLCKKLHLHKRDVRKAYQTMLTTQEVRKHNPNVRSTHLTPYIHSALGGKCKNCELATSLLRKLYTDLQVG